MSDVFHELMGAFELFRRAGFEPEDIFVALEPGSVGVTLVGEGGARESIRIGTFEAPPGFAEMWDAAAAWWNREATESERAAIYLSSAACLRGAATIGRMELAGFRPRGGWDPRVRPVAEALARRPSA